jgi:hypothetical protein
LRHVLGVLKENGNLLDEEREKLKAEYFAKNCMGACSGDASKIMALLKHDGVDCTQKEIEALLT